MTAAFEKWSGAGNDFILMEASELASALSPAQAARRLCARRRGIGADGLILLRSGRADYWNCDGSPAAFCGNGARCVGAHLLARSDEAKVAFSFGAIATSAWRDRAEIVVTVPTPYYERAALDPAILGDAAPSVTRASLVSAGVPHVVLRADRIETLALEAWAPGISHHPDFGPAGVNVTLVGADQRVRTWERGIESETLACGSGCLAAARVLYDEGKQKKIALQTKGGDLLTVYAEADGWLLRGPALKIFRGVAEMPELAP